MKRVQTFGAAAMRGESSSLSRLGGLFQHPGSIDKSYTRVSVSGLWTAGGITLDGTVRFPQSNGRT